MTSYRRWNILTDLTYIETFYERQSDGTLVKAAIPDAGIDFTIDYFTDGATHFKASRIDGVRHTFQTTSWQPIKSPVRKMLPRQNRAIPLVWPIRQF